MVGYGPLGSIRALVVKPYLEEQRCKELIIRDYQARRVEFPMKQHNIDHDQDHTSWSKIFDGEAVWRPGTRSNRSPSVYSSGLRKVGDGSRRYLLVLP